MWFISMGRVKVWVQPGLVCGSAWVVKVWVQPGLVCGSAWVGLWVQPGFVCGSAWVGLRFGFSLG